MTTTQPTPMTGSPSGRSSAAWPRYVNALIAAWLFISAFAWPHARDQFTNSWVVGVLMFIAALLALGAPMIRFANTILAIWLVISTLAMGVVHIGTLWNNVIVAVVAFIVSLIPSQTGAPTGRRPSAQNPT